MSTFGLKQSQTESGQVHFHRKWIRTFPANTAPKHKDYLSSGTEGCNKECMIAMKSEAMRPCDGLQITQQSQFRELEWRLMRAISIGTGCEVKDRSLGTCSGTKQPKHNNISVIDGVGVKFIFGTDERVSV